MTFIQLTLTVAVPYKTVYFTVPRNDFYMKLYLISGQTADREITV